MSYGPNDIELYRQAAVKADKILKGAKALGITLPQGVLMQAERLIE